MKKISFVVLLTTGLMLGSYAQDKQQDKLNEKNVPAVVQTSFKNEFTNAKDIEWKMKDGKYKVAFEINGTDHFAKYGTDGKLMAKGMKIRTSELPNAVSTSVKSSYADRTIDDVYRVDKDG